MKDNKSQIIAGVIVGLLIGIFGIMWWNGHGSTPVTQSTTNTGSSNNNGVATATSSLYESDAPGSVVGDGPGIFMDEQNPGKVVIISQVAFLKPGWVVIHDNVDGKPGAVIGSKYFEQGKHSGLIILQKSMVIGKKYFAELHNDDGNSKTFDPAKDTPLKDAKGMAIMVSFAVTQGSDKAQ